MGNLLIQRINALALGHEDLHNPWELPHNPALVTVAKRMEALEIPSTLCRLEQRAVRETAVAIHSHDLPCLHPLRNAAQFIRDIF